MGEVLAKRGGPVPMEDSVGGSPGGRRCQRPGRTTKRYARGYALAAKKDTGRLLDELVGVASWSRANARCATAAARVSAQVLPGRWPASNGHRTYGYDTRRVLIDVWTLIGETPAAPGRNTPVASSTVSGGRGPRTSW